MIGIGAPKRLRGLLVRAPCSVHPPEAPLARQAGQPRRQLQVPGSGKGEGGAEPGGGPAGIPAPAWGEREPLLLLASTVGLGTQCVAGAMGHLRARRVRYEGVVSDEEAGEVGRGEAGGGQIMEGPA